MKQTVVQARPFASTSNSTDKYIAKYTLEMAQSGPVPPVHTRRQHRPEHHPIDQNNSNVAISAARFGETEWEARDVCFAVMFCLMHWCKSKFNFKLIVHNI